MQKLSKNGYVRVTVSSVQKLIEDKLLEHFLFMQKRRNAIALYSVCDDIFYPWMACD